MLMNVYLAISKRIKVQAGNVYAADALQVVDNMLKTEGQRSVAQEVEERESAAYSNGFADGRADYQAAVARAFEELIGGHP